MLHIYSILFSVSDHYYETFDAYTNFAEKITAKNCYCCWWNVNDMRLARFLTYYELNTEYDAEWMSIS